MRKSNTVNGFFKVTNEVINASGLTLKAKMLWIYFMSKPEGWVFSIEGICKTCNDGIASVRSGIKELEDKGYIFKSKASMPDGKFRYSYVVYRGDGESVEKPDYEWRSKQDWVLAKQIEKEGYLFPIEDDFGVLPVFKPVGE